MKRVLFKKESPVVMGVLNSTPDSFSDGGKFVSVKAALKEARAMIAAGAAVLDIGGESTRPGATPVSVEEELQRVIPVITAIRSEFGDAVVLSLDTYKAAVAEQGLAAGVDIINDISGLQFDSRMAQVVAAASCQVIINHTFGRPQTMQHDLPVRKDVVGDVLEDIQKFVTDAEQAGVQAQNIIVDPGFGFGKSYQDNLDLLNQLERIVELGFPVLVGMSRKKFTETVVQQYLRNAEEITASERLGSSLAAHTLATYKGAAMIRVHDVAQHVQAMAVVTACNQ